MYTKRQKLNTQVRSELYDITQEDIDFIDDSEANLLLDTKAFLRLRQLKKRRDPFDQLETMFNSHIGLNSSTLTWDLVKMCPEIESLLVPLKGICCYCGKYRKHLTYFFRHNSKDYFLGGDCATHLSEIINLIKSI